jgi:hypothetical protein
MLVKQQRHASMQRLRRHRQKMMKPTSLIYNMIVGAIHYCQLPLQFFIIFCGSLCETNKQETRKASQQSACYLYLSFSLGLPFTEFRVDTKKTASHHPSSRISNDMDIL